MRSSWRSFRLPSPNARRAFLAAAGLFFSATTIGLPVCAQTETVLHSFDIQHDKSDGVNPESLLLLDRTETDLYHFKGGVEAAGPLDGVHLDAAGALFGTTVGGGAHGDGTVFKLTQSNGVWKEKILYSLAGGKDDGVEPFAGVVEDQNGVVFGTTAVDGSDDVDCGSSGGGTVFEVT